MTTSIMAWRALRPRRWRPCKDGTKVYSGPWKIPRPEDPRHFVIVEPAEGKTLVYWGTPKVKDTLEATAWPRVYRERNERQENSFKRMIDHGALNTNYGRKKIVGPDRHQQRATRATRPSAGGGPEAASIRRSRRSRRNRPRWPSPRPKGMANAWSSVSAPWQCWKRRAKTPSTNTTNSLRKLLPWDHLGSGRIAIFASRRS